jgi:hypothetical protein
MIFIITYNHVIFRSILIKISIIKVHIIIINNVISVMCSTYLFTFEDIKILFTNTEVGSLFATIFLKCNF